MRERPIVHIGFHKTATTWFQKSFYPLVRNGRYVSRAAVRAAFLDPPAFHFDADSARLHVTSGRSDRVLICEEGLSGYLHNGGLAGHLSEAMARRIKETLPDAQLVIFIRAQPAMLGATYQQYVKGGGTYGVRRYLFPHRHLTGASAENAKVPRFLFEHFEYDHLIRLYRQLFGTANVHVFLFEEFRQDPQAFLARFCAALSLEADLDAIQLKPVYRSYSRPAMILSRLLARFTYRTVLDKHWIVHIPFWYLLVRAISEGLSRLPFSRAPGPRELFGEKLLAWIEQRYAASNRRLAEETGLPLERFGYPMKQTNQISPPPLRRWLPRWISV